MRLLAAIAGVLAIGAVVLAVALSRSTAAPSAAPSPSPTPMATPTQTAAAVVTTAPPASSPSPTPSPSPVGEPVPGITTHTIGWRPSGPTAIVQEFTYTGEGPHEATLLAVPLDGSAPTRLFSTADRSIPAMRRDGSAVAITMREGEGIGGRIAVWETASGSTRWLTPNETGVAAFNPVWSPDGRSVYFGQSRGEEDLGLWHIRADASDLRRVVGPRTSDAPPTVTIPHLITQEGVLLWGRAYEGSSLELLDLTTGRAASYGFGELFDWRAEQPRALIGSCSLGCHGLVEWNDVSGSKRELYSTDVMVQGAAREPGGDRIAAARFGPPWTLVIVQPDGPSQPIPGSEGARRPHWIGAVIVYTWDRDISEQIPRTPPSEIRAISPTGDSVRTLYRVGQADRTVHVIDVVR